MKSVCFVFCIVFLCGGVLCLEGVSPGSYEIEFKAGLEKEFVFDFVLADTEDVFIEGDLIEHVTLDRSEVSKRGRVVATVKLPEEADRFGVNNIWVVAGDVRGLIKVVAPYPENFVDLDLNIANVNVGDKIEGVLKVLNFGAEDVEVSPVIDVYSGEGVVYSYALATGKVDVGGSRVFSFKLGGVGEEYLAGDYLAVARVDYGDEEAADEDLFRVGEFKLKVLDWTRQIRAGEIGRFEVEVESLWDEKIDEVFAEVRGYGGAFDTSIVSLEPWERKTLSGFFDARGLDGGLASFDVVVNYDGAVVSEVVEVRIIGEADLWLWVGLGFLGLLVLGALGWKFFRK